jgi:predicted transcriptional regulator
MYKINKTITAEEIFALFVIRESKDVSIYNINNNFLVSSRNINNIFHYFQNQNSKKISLTFAKTIRKLIKKELIKNSNNGYDYYSLTELGFLKVEHLKNIEDLNNFLISNNNLINGYVDFKINEGHINLLGTLYGSGRTKESHLTRNTSDKKLINDLVFNGYIEFLYRSRKCSFYSNSVEDNNNAIKKMLYFPTIKPYNKAACYYTITNKGKEYINVL